MLKIRTLLCLKMLVSDYQLVLHLIADEQNAHKCGWKSAILSLFYTNVSSFCVISLTTLVIWDCVNMCVCLHVRVCMHFCVCVKCIQGVTGGMCKTSGECSLGQTTPI